jgi:hypothetical protein
MVCFQLRMKFYSCPQTSSEVDDSVEDECWFAHSEEQRNVADKEAVRDTFFQAEAPLIWITASRTSKKPQWNKSLQETIELGYVTRATLTGN